jgi:hypothetical protein
MFKLALLLITVLNISAIFAQDVQRTDPDFRMSPGNMGPNAFSWLWHVRDARVIGDKIIIDAGLRNSYDRYNQATQTAIVKVEIPFSELASLEFSNTLEKWKLNTKAMAAYGATDSKGFDAGDVVAAVKFRLAKEARFRPAIAISGIFKTASGADENARFTDTAGYAININFAKDIFKSAGVLRKLRLLGEFGFGAWDDGPSSQNDIYRYGGAAIFDFKGHSSLDIGIHGYTGWRNNGDKPLTLYVEGRKVFSPTVTAFGGIDLGLNSSATKSTYSAGIRIQLVRKYKK